MTEEIRFCPRCGSIDVKINISPSLVFGIPQNWICNECGYSNLIFPIKILRGKSKKLKNGTKKN